MQIVYSALHEGEITHQQPGDDIEDEMQLRLQAHYTVCKKYKDEIKLIRQRLPHWQPAFHLRNY